ncbi:hypothetical protein EJ08DRAFT_653483 [Tothia fuscella]|uniref:Cell wall mannoprotein 1 n=1 Tax=Tothia fuscella TaxID=1048955 RepID=A0A9P4NH18_9PEZI|nr:hypothetical protein EJ08DRAFT_653483 [Tothia fuscella]
MKFTLPILAIALGASATLVERDGASIQKVLSDISSKTDALDTIVKGFSGDAKALIAASDDLISSIKSGISTVTASAVLPIADAANIAQNTIGLNTSAAAVISDLISKKDALVSAGQGGTVLKSLQDQRAVSKSLAEAITSKVPTALQATAAELSSGIDASFARGIAAFEGTGGSGGSSSPSATATSASSAPSSSSPSASATGGHTGGGHSSSAGPTSAGPTSAAPTSAAPSKSGASSGTPATFTGAAAAFATPLGALAAVAVILAF